MTTRAQRAMPENAIRKLKTSTDFIGDQLWLPEKHAGVRFLSFSTEIRDEMRRYEGGVSMDLSFPNLWGHHPVIHLSPTCPATNLHHINTFSGSYATILLTAINIALVHGNPRGRMNQSGWESATTTSSTLQLRNGGSAGVVFPAVTQNS